MEKEDMEIIFNEDCFESMKRFEENGDKVNVILTSPPYNTGRPYTSEKARKNNEARYDIHMDTMTQDEYIDWTIKLFNEFDKILAKDGVILWNISYGSDGTVNTSSIGLVWLVIADIIRKTNFTTADRIIWKKKSALPNNVSKNKLTRIVEDVFVFCRKDEYKTYKEAYNEMMEQLKNYWKNNDCDDLLEKLLKIKNRIDFYQRKMLYYD